MNLQECLATVSKNPDQWFRPVSWHGTGVAYTIELGHTLLVPTSRGESAEMTCCVSELMGEWSVVSVDEVFSERLVE